MRAEGLSFAILTTCLGTTGLAVAEGVSTDKNQLTNLLSQQVVAPSISKQDIVFADQGLQFVWGHQNIDLDELNRLFEKVRRMGECQFGTLC